MPTLCYERPGSDAPSVKIQSWVAFTWAQERGPDALAWGPGPPAPRRGRGARRAGPGRRERRQSGGLSVGCVSLGNPELVCVIVFLTGVWNCWMYEGKTVLFCAGSILSANDRVVNDALLVVSS